MNIKQYLKRVGNNKIIPDSLRDSTIALYTTRPQGLSDFAVDMTNAVTNGDFSNGTTGWLKVNVANDSVTDGILTFTATAQNGLYYNSPNPATVIGRSYFGVIRVKADSNLVKLNIGGTFYAHSGSGNWETLFVVRQATTTGHNLQCVDQRVSGWTPIQVDYGMMIDLSAPFGLSNEPTASEFADMLTYKGKTYWNGTEPVVINPNDKYYWPDRGGAIYKQMTNLLGALGDFEGADLSGWANVGSGMSLSIDHYYKGTKSLKVIDSSNSTEQLLRANGYATTAGDVIYACLYQYVESQTSGAGDMSIRNSVGTIIGAEVSCSTATGAWNFNSIMRTATDSVVRFNIRTGVSAINTSYLDCIHLLNLTTIFGPGNEPSQSQMDGIMRQYINANGYLNSGQVDTHLPKHLHAVNVAYDATGGVQAGPPANWLCDGVNDYLVYNSQTDIVAANGAVSAFVVFQAKDAVPAGSVRLLRLSNQLGSYVLSIAPIPTAFEALGSSGTTITSLPATVLANTWYSCYVQYNSTSGKVGISSLGGLVSESVGTGTTVALTRVVLCASNTFTSNANAREAEVYLFNKVLTQAEIKSLHNNIASRYGLTKV